MYQRWRHHGRSFDLGRMTLRELLVAWGTHPAIHAYAVLAVLSGAWAVQRTLADGTPLWRLLLAVVLAEAAYPVVWYGLHRFVLHGRWLYRSRWTAALWKRVHFDHHQDPHRLDVLFGSPLNVIPTIVLLLCPVGWLVGGWAGAGAALCAGFLTTCAYELVHSMQHLNYKPRAAWLRRAKELHLAHHFHHEGGNYGITEFAVDRALGTFYAGVRDRPRSPHVFNLGYDRAEAERFPWVAELSGGPPRDRPPPARDRQAAPGPAE
ncbi:sterol desaturase family protein [Roseomonas sp. BN140053]|uniref:sterol desaturase family protein n=1 Tax=Roseomonas sp. BN140053 TaxID=3391898 RepID=UPI0039E7C137